MSVRIDNQSGSIFTATPDGVTRTTSDNSTYAATTAFVKSFISNYLFPITSAIGLTLPTLTFSSVYTRVLITTALRGAVSIGKATSIIKLFNNIIITDTNYPYVLSADNTNTQRIQAGYYTSGTIPTSIVTPKTPAGTANAYATPSTSVTCGVQTTTGTGFNVYLGTATSNEIHWLLFQTN